MSSEIFDGIRVVFGGLGVVVFVGLVDHAGECEGKGAGQEE